MNYQRGQLIATGSFTRVYEPILDGKVIEDKVLLYTNCPFKEINCVHSNHYNILPYCHNDWSHDENQRHYYSRLSKYTHTYLMERLPKFQKSKLNAASKVLFEKAKLFRESVNLLLHKKPKYNRDVQLCDAIRDTVYAFDFFTDVKFEGKVDLAVYDPLVEVDKFVAYKALVEEFQDLMLEVTNYNCPRIDQITPRNLSYREDGTIVFLDLFFEGKF